MNNLRQKTNEHAPGLESENPEYPFEQNIGGYEGGNRSFLKEPSLYLSIAAILVASVCLGNTPTIFWLSFISLSVVAVIFHILAERQIFKTYKNHQALDAPFDGIFVLTFGSILPGLVMLAYGIHSTATAVERNLPEECGKLAFVLLVPLFNFYVWSAVRKKFLARPRLVGTMNGLAIGLSSVWSVVLMKLMFLSQGDPSCKFGWVLMLFMAPFLLFSCTCLSLDLWRRTEPSIARITKAFSILGVLVSMLFVGTPLARSIVVQSMLIDAKQGTFSKKAKAVSALRAVATPQDLRPSRNPISGFALASLLIPNRGLDSGSDVDKDAYFKITGRPYFSNPHESANDTEQSPNVGAKVPGLSLSKSQITGSIDATTLSSSIDWTLTLHNSTSNATEGRGEIRLPKQAVVSRVTLWINGEPREAAFSSTSLTSQAYESVVSRSRDPLLVTMPAPDRVLFQCFPVQPNSKMRIRLGFKVPLQTADGKTCSIKLPQFLSTNFTQPRRHRINISTQDVPIQNLPGMVAEKHPNGYSLRGIMKSDEDGKNMSLVLKRTLPLQEMATPDWYSHGKRYIVQQLEEVTTSSPARLFVVVDLSESLKNKSAEVKKMLEDIPSSVKPVVYLAKEPTDNELTEQEQFEKKQAAAEQSEEDQDEAEHSGVSQESTLKTEAFAKPVKEALASIEPDAFSGGQDNHPLVREALEAAAEAPNCAVLWIHGPQPLSQNVYDFTPLDLVHGVRLFDLQLGKGPNSVLSALEREDTAKLVLRKTLVHKSTTNDLGSLWSDWSEGSKRLAVRRTITASRPQMTIVTDRLASAEVTSLWAQGEVSRLVSMEQEGKAIELASNYRLVTPVSGAVVLETPKEYEAFKLNPGKWRAGASDSASPLNQYVASSGGPGLVGAPVDPRYGQSNEVGQLADFGYDTARDISRMGTALSTLIALIIAAGVLRSGGAITSSRLVKAVVLVVSVPTVVHLIGTFAINNYGGLGGGL